MHSVNDTDQKNKAQNCLHFNKTTTIIGVIVKYHFKEMLFTRAMEYLIEAAIPNIKNIYWH